MSEVNKSRFPRVVRRERSPADTRSSWTWNPSELWATIKSYVGLGRKARQDPIASKQALATFLNERASYVAQVSLYGYLRTRAGMRYPELFDDDPFVASINIAKWHVWLDCLADVTVFAGSHLAREAPRDVPRIAKAMNAAVENILGEIGTPSEAGSEFGAHAARLRNRIARTDWLAVGPDEAAFTDSPASLVRWAPIVDELKALDEEIVRNSVRFRWQQVRRDFVQFLDLNAVLDEIRTTDP